MDAVRPPGAAGYDKAARLLLDTRLDFEEVHRHILHLLPASGGRILDVGAGPGHDAATLARRGHSVVAVEPTPQLRDGAKALYPDLPIAWLEDSLPRLESLPSAALYDFILVEGVWAHLDAEERAAALPRLGELLAPKGVLAISLRHGPAAPGRVGHPVTAEETIILARASGLATLVNVATASIQPANVASGITWSRMAFGKAR